jgi:hypothetical protein
MDMTDKPNSRASALRQPETVQSLTYQGHPIALRGEMLNLTDMWRAAGSNPFKRPADWARKDGADFILHVGDILNMPQGHIKTERGRGGATLAHWQIGLAYAKCLSPEFHMWCNTVVRERMEGPRPSGDVTVQELGRDVRQVLGGIVKAVVSAQTEPLARALLDMRRDLDALVADPAVQATVEYRPMLDVVKEMGVGPKKRRSITQRLSARCRRWCLRNDRQTDVRESRETKRFLFHVDALAEFMAAEGNMLVADHKTALGNQTVMAFRPRKDPKGGGAA